MTTNPMNKTNTNSSFDRFTFANLTKRAGQPMSYNGDFDDNFTAEDYERRQYQRDARDFGY